MATTSGFTGTHHPHGHTEYAPPVLRASSPASSVGTSYGQDQTDLSDTELSQAEFEAKWEERLQLRMPMREEMAAEVDPLVPRPIHEVDRRAMCDAIIHNLRLHIQKLEENEIFERTLLRGSQAALEPQPTTTDIDLLMKGMMGPAMSLQHRKKAGMMMIGPSSQAVTNGPWNNYGVAATPNVSVNGGGGEGVSGTTVGKRSRGDRSRT